MNSNIIHIISASTYHLTPNLITNLIQKVPFNHFFFVIGKKNKPINWNLYSDLFEQLNYSNYMFSNSLDDVKKIKGINSNSFIILHGDSYKRMLFFYFRQYKNYHWICWGSGTKINRSLKSIISSLLKSKVYKKFRSIIALTETDKIELQNNFRLSKIYTIPYLGSLHNMEQFKKVNLSQDKTQNNVIYIGNNYSCINTYSEIVHKLKKIASIVDVRCMLNYDLNKDETFKNLDKDGKAFFGNKFKMNTEFYDLKDYPDYMDVCDIYICNADRQTGLAAIYITLALGKKLFLRGNNYDFIKSIGCNIYHIDDIDRLSAEEFLAPLPIQVKEKNFDLIMDYLDESKTIKKWSVFFKENLEI
ncbi:hypothetical protein [Chryseobacterium terrae]|uniref:4-alpha-L-fucosyltransferase glycosyl transferase group 56 n=1 Tax=Chryseobacterium terrae TaxID=3163299 RepID=A0ABW8Y6R3_9FLAO